MKMYLSNIIRTEDSVPIPKLTEQAAIELGANLLGEFVIIAVASSILLWEYNRQQGKEEIRERKETEFVNQLEQRITDLAFENAELDAKIRELTRLVYSTPTIMANHTKALRESSSVEADSDSAINKAVKEAQTKISPRI
ncbi:hypothetical protein HAZT_HAZT006211 [Hyalella azteca]|nr:hypothetical protein HAZT_HAZT006211 [Hyalella azteca]